MASLRQIKIGIIKDMIRRFNHLPDRTIARVIIEQHKDLFDNDIEKVRTRVRYFRGHRGEPLKEAAQKAGTLITPPKELTIPHTWRKIRTPYILSEGYWLVLSDIHVPFHEIKPIEAAIQDGQADKVTGILLNGDAQDCRSVTFWPTARRDFNAESAAFIDFLDFLRQEFPKKPIVYRPGNHEYRLPQAYVSKLPELAETPLAAMETVIDFEGRGIEFLDYHQLVMAGDLPILHGHEVRNIQKTVNTARGLFLKTKTFAACSHCHNTSMHTARDLLGKMITTWSFACLCDLSPDYNPFCNDWNWGYAKINVEKDGNFEVVNKRVLDSGKVV